MWSHHRSEEPRKVLVMVLVCHSTFAVWCYHFETNTCINKILVNHSAVETLKVTYGVVNTESIAWIQDAMPASLHPCIDHRTSLDTHLETTFWW